MPPPRINIHRHHGTDDHERDISFEQRLDPQTKEDEDEYDDADGGSASVVFAFDHEGCDGGFVGGVEHGFFEVGVGVGVGILVG